MNPITRSAHEQAERLGISYDQLVKNCRRGDWPCHKFGRLVRFTDDDEAQILKITASDVSAVAADGISPRTAARLAAAS